MVPSGIRLDLADGTLCLPDEVRILLNGRRPPYRATIQAITIPDQYVVAVEWILKQRERTTNTHSAVLPTYGGGTPIPCRVNLGSYLVYPSAWLVLQLDLTWSLYRPGLGGPRVDMLHSGPGFLGSIDLTRAMHLVLCTPLVANGFLAVRPLCVPLREPLPLAGLTWWCFDTHLTPQANYPEDQLAMLEPSNTCRRRGAKGYPARNR